MIFVTNDDVMGSNIRYLRQREHLSPEVFAKNLGISVSALQRIENGEILEIEAWVLNQICEYFSTDVQTLVEKNIENIL